MAQSLIYTNPSMHLVSYTLCCHVLGGLYTSQSTSILVCETVAPRCALHEIFYNQRHTETLGLSSLEVFVCLNRVR